MPELLAALLVVAAGVLGVAAVYSDQSRAPRDVQLHLQAAELADAMAERIRAAQLGRDGFAMTVGVVCDASLKPRSPQDRAALEAACWADEVARSLPSGLGSINRDVSTAPPAYVVAVSWSAAQSGTASYVVRVTTL